MIWKRLKNLWEWSKQNPNDLNIKDRSKNMVDLIDQGFIKAPRRPARIIEESSSDLLEE